MRGLSLGLGLTSPVVAAAGGGEALGDELVTNGTFDSDTAWTKTNTAIADGIATMSTGGLGPKKLEQAIGTLVNGTTYRLSFEILSISAGSVSPGVGGQTGTSRTAAGVYVEDIVCGSGTASLFLNGPPTAATIELDNISLKEVL